MSTVIDQDTVWASSYYDLRNKSVVVFPNVTLTIRGQSPEKPLIVEFANSTAINLKSFAKCIIDGNVQFKGNLADYRFGPGNQERGKGIQAVSANDPTVIQITGLTCSNMTFCVGIQRAANMNSPRTTVVNITNSTFQYNRKTLDLASTTARLHDSIFQFNLQNLFGRQSSIHVDNCMFRNNSEGALAVQQQSDLTVVNSEFRYNNHGIAATTVTTLNSTFKGNNRGISIDNAYGSGKSSDILNCIFRDHSKYALQFGTGVLNISDSLFLRNEKAISFVRNYYKGEGGISSSVFAYNNKAVQYDAHGLPNISSSLFIGNQIGVGGLSSEYWSRADVNDTLFFQNEIAVFLPGNYHSLSLLTFIENGISLRSGVTGESLVQFGILEKSNFFNATTYHIRLMDNSHGDMDASDLYWNDDNDTSKIRSQVYDVYQDGNVGMVTIEPLATAPFYGTVFRSTDWTVPKSFKGVLLEPNVSSSTARDGEQGQSTGPAMQATKTNMPSLSPTARSVDSEIPSEAGIVLAPSYRPTTAPTIDAQNTAIKDTGWEYQHDQARWLSISLMLNVILFGVIFLLLRRLRHLSSTTRRHLHGGTHHAVAQEEQYLDNVVIAEPV